MIAEPPAPVRRLPVEHGGRGRLAPAHGEHARAEVGVGEVVIGAGPGGDLPALREHRGGRRLVPLHEGHPGAPPQGPGPEHGRRRAERQTLGEPAPALARVVPDPVVQEVGGHGQAGLGLARLREGPLQRLVQVAVLGVQPYVPVELGRPEVPLPRLPREVAIVVPVPPPPDRLLPGLGEPLPAVLPDRVEQPVPCLAIPLLPDQHGLLHQPGDQVDDLGLADAVAGADLLGRLQGEAVAEHAGTLPEQPLLRGAQVVAPVDQRAQRPLAGRRGARSRGEQPEAVVQPLQQLLNGEGAQPDGGELDREGQPVEAAADLQHDRQVRLGHREIRAYGGDPLGEEPDRVRLRGARQRPGPGDRQRGELQGLLARDAERLPAGGEDPQAGKGAQQPVCEHGAILEEVLAVVEHDEHPPIRQVLDEHIDRRLGRGDPDAVGVGERLTDQRGLVHIGELDEAHPAGEGPPYVEGDPEGEAGLPHPSHAGDGDQPGDREQTPGLGGLPPPPDEARHLGR